MVPVYVRPVKGLGDVLYIAVEDPGADEGLREVSERSGLRVRPMIASPSDLRRALDRDELSVQYQPILDLSTQTIASVEALIRWQHPVRGFFSPDAFLPVASTLFTYRLLRRDLALGPSALIGLHVGEGASSIGEAIDYGAMVTVGYTWLRLSVGGIWRRELDADRLQADDGGEPVAVPLEPSALAQLGEKVTAAREARREA